MQRSYIKHFAFILISSHPWWIVNKYSICAKGAHKIFFFNKFIYITRAHVVQLILILEVWSKLFFADSVFSQEWCKYKVHIIKFLWKFIFWSFSACIHARFAMSCSKKGIAPLNDWALKKVSFLSHDPLLRYDSQSIN